MKETLKELFFVLSDKQYGKGIELLQNDLLEKEVISHVFFGMTQNKTFLNRYQKESLSENSVVVTDNSLVYELLCSKKYANIIVMIQEENRYHHFAHARYAIESLENLDYDYFEKVYLRFCGLPWEIGTTERCLLREMTVKDVDALYELYEGSEITNYMEGLYEDRDEEIAYIKDYIEKVYAFYGIGTWLIVQKATGKIIGRAGFNWRAGYEEPELGFMIAKPYQGQGFAREVCSKILQIGVDEYGFDAVQALIRIGNTVSEHLCETLDFVYQDEVVEDGVKHHRYVWVTSKE